MQKINLSDPDWKDFDNNLPNPTLVDYVWIRLKSNHEAISMVNIMRGLDVDEEGVDIETVVVLRFGTELSQEIGGTDSYGFTPFETDDWEWKPVRDLTS